MFSTTNRTRTPTEQKHFERVNVLARFADRFSEAREQSQYLTFPFGY